MSIIEQLSLGVSGALVAITFTSVAITLAYRTQVRALEELLLEVAEPNIALSLGLEAAGSDMGLNLNKEETSKFLSFLKILLEKRKEVKE